MSAKVKMYGLSGCNHCRHCKEFLESKHVDFDCVFVDLLSGEEREQAIMEVRKLNPEISFPTLIIGDQIIVGFDEEAIERALKE